MNNKLSALSKIHIDEALKKSFSRETIKETNNFLMYGNLLGLITLIVLSTYDILTITSDTVINKLLIAKIVFASIIVSFTIYYFKASNKNTKKYIHSLNALTYILFLLTETIIVESNYQQIFHISTSLIIINISLFLIFKLKIPIAFIFSIFTMLIFNINFLRLNEINNFNIGIIDVNIWYTLSTLGSWIISRYIYSERINAFITHQHLKEAQVTKYKLFGVVSHDLKNIIASQTSLTSYLSSSKENISTKDLYKLLDVLHKSSLDALSTFEELMIWVKSQMKAIKPNTKEINIEELINFQVGQISNLAAEKNVTIEFDRSKINHIKSDSTIISLVFRNLLTNAIKFSEEGSKIEINTFEDSSDYCIEVKDYGIGIPPELIQELVSEEKLITTPGTNGEKGTGLGLSLSKTLISQINGKIQLSNNKDKGISAKIRLNKLNKIT